MVRIDNICNSSTVSEVSTGTGFLIAPDLVATVAHVVEDGGALRVTSPTRGLSVSAEVVGYDHADDLALLRTNGPLPGHVFKLASGPPDIGTEMAAIGFPFAQSMQLTIGHITGDHVHREVGGEFDLSNVLISDAALNHGNSGGPWITMDGAVIALDESGPPEDSSGRIAAEGDNGGVSGVDASKHFSTWRADPHPDDNRACQPASSTAAAEETLELYFFAIDNGDYATAFAQEDPANHSLSGFPGFRDGVQSSTDAASDGSDAYFSIDATGFTPGNNVYMDVSFRSHQHASQGPNGETCTDWTLRYKFVRRHGLELISSSPKVPGTAGHTGC